MRSRPTSPLFRPLALGAVALALAGASCTHGGGDAQATPSPQPASTFVAISSTPAARTDPDPGGGVTVKTIAGTGAFGIADGPASSATFMLPSALARGADGTLYIADEAGQRIRALGRDGVVHTVAGSGDVGPDRMSVHGGFRDGPALSAQFSRPAGLAFGPDGALYIADSRNGCIRKLNAGSVSTAVGECEKPEGTDGGRGTAKLLDPRALAFDRKGDMWIADYGAGLRRVDPNGNVTTMTFKEVDDKRVWGVGIGGDPDDTTIVASTPERVLVYHPATGANEAYNSNAPAEGNRPFGNASQIVGLDHRQFLFTDVVSSDVRYLRLPAKPFATTIFTRVLAGGTAERAIDNAGFRDGPASEARFYAPRGIAVSNRVVYVADSGNRRIREFDLPNTRVSESGLADLTPYDTGHYQIVYIGASWAYWDSLGDDSICGRLERDLDAARRFSKPVRCHPVRIDAASFPQIESYISNYLNGHVDLLVINTNLAEVSSLFPNNAPPSMDALGSTLRQHVETLAGRVARDKTKVMLLWNYDPDDVSDAENLFERDQAGRREFPVELRDNYYKGTKIVIDALHSSLADECDTYDGFMAYELRPGRPPLYGTDDSHLSPQGSALLAQILAGCIRSDKRL